MLPVPARRPSVPPEPTLVPECAPETAASPDIGVLGMPETSGANSRIELAGPSGVLHVWLGGATDPAALEADVRAVSASALPRAATAVALGEVARRHRLEVRILPRVDEQGAGMLVLFGKRLHAPRR